MVKSNLMIPFILRNVNVRLFRRYCSVLSDEGVQFETARVFNSIAVFTEKIHNINVVYTKEAETADMYIEKITHEIGKKHRVRVATSDNLEQIIILGNGATRLSANELLQEVKLAEKTIMNIINSN